MMKTPKIEAMLREAMYHASNFYLERESEKRKNGEVINYHDLTVECMGEFVRMGGDLMNCGVELDEIFIKDMKRIDANLKNPISHYYNIVEGNIIDLTKQQFIASKSSFSMSQGIFKPKDFESTRQYVLSFSKTVERYEILKRKVEKFLTGRK